MKILNEYPGSHHYWTTFEKGKLFCVNCGAQEVWEEGGAGDYYCGADFICIKCDHRWTLQGPSLMKEPNEIVTLEQIKQGKTFEPKTKKGG